MRRRLALLLAPVVLAGCGGGGGSEPAASDRGEPEQQEAEWQRPMTYAAARRRGQPIAVLRRPTALLDGRGRRVARLGMKTEFGAPSVLTVTGVRGGRLRVIATQLPNGRRGWVRAADARFSFTPWRVTADLSERVVTVRRGGRTVRRIRVSIGSPRTPTPTGRFAVTDKLKLSGGSRAYGWGVLALSGHQPHIEPGWRGGDRLAIHGTASPGTIGSAASFGCLRASRADVRWLVRSVWLGSVVTIRR